MRVFLLIFIIVATNAQTNGWAKTSVKASNATFSRIMTKNQLNIRTLNDISETNQYRCLQNPAFYQRLCHIYCRIYYDYVPLLPGKNLRKYNQNTGYCEQGPPRCPPRLGVYYDQQSGKCVDEVNGLILSPLQPVAPVYNNSDLINVTFICMYGEKRIFNGFQQCLCWVGFKSILVDVYSSTADMAQATILLCNKQALLGEYLPKAYSINIDELQINRWPYAADNAYWIKLLIYFIRQLKFAVGCFFRPWEVAIGIFIIPQQSLIRANDIPIIIWAFITISLIFLLTIYEKKVHGKTAQQLS